MYLGCPLNKMKVAGESTALHEVFEEYALDQQKWIDDYLPTFEKMLANGYEEGELVDGPDQYTNVYCKRHDFGDDWSVVQDFNCNKVGTK